MAKAGKLGSTGTNRQVALLKESQTLAKDIGLAYENIVDLQQMILNNQIRSTDELVKQLKTARESQTKVEDEVKQEQRKLKTLREQAEAKEDLRDLSNEMVKPLRKISTLTEDTYESDLKRIKTAKDLGVVTADQASNMEQQLTAMNKLSKNPIVKKGFSEAADSIDKMQDGLNSFLKDMPGGEFLGKALGLDKLGERLQYQLLTSGKIGTIGLVAALGAAFVVLQKITDEANKLSTETGLTFGQARKLADESRTTAANIGLQLATAQDLVDVQKESIAAFGTSAMLTGEQAANVAELGKSFGYGAQQAAKVNNAFMAMGVTSDEALNAQRSLSAEALKAGVNVGAVTKDIAENAKGTAKYFGGNVQALKKAAVEAAKLGMSIATMAKVSDSLLNIESSLQAQFEFQAMTGRQINLDKARELALTGDIAGATKEVLGAVGSTAEFNKLNSVQRKKLAEATGMEVDELQKSLVIQEKLGDLTDEQKAAMSGLNLSAAELSKLSDKELQAKLAEQQSMNETSKKLDDFKNTMMNALVPLAEVLGTIFAGLAPALKLVMAPIQFISDIVSSITTLFTDGWDSLTGWGQALSVIGIILGTVLLPTIVSAAWGLLSGAVSAIYQGLSMIPYGLGIPIAIATAGGLVGMFTGMIGKTKSVGDFGEGDGPAVYSPTENAIFQGTPNDQVVMAPGAYDAATGNNAGTSVAVDMTETNNLLRQLLTAMKSPAPVQIGNRVITEIGNQLNTDKSYRQGYNGAGGR